MHKVKCFSIFFTVLFVHTLATLLNGEHLSMSYLEINLTFPEMDVSYKFYISNVYILYIHYIYVYFKCIGEKINLYIV